jgi:hypothetical protein
MTIPPRRLVDRAAKDVPAPTGNGILRLRTLPTMLVRTITVATKFALISV